MVTLPSGIDQWIGTKAQSLELAEAIREAAEALPDPPPDLADALREVEGGRVVRVLCDVDGVVADFASEVVRISNEVCRDLSNWRERTVDDVTCFDMREALGLTGVEWDQAREFIDGNGFARALKPYPGAVDAICALASLYDVHLVTAPWPSKTWCFDRAVWCVEKLPLLPFDVTFTHAKHLIAGDVFIEDKPETLEAWCNAHPRGLGILWNRPWNASYDLHPAKGAIVRVSKWDEVMAVVDAVDSRSLGALVASRALSKLEAP